MTVDVVRAKRFLDPVRIVFFVASQVLERRWQVAPGIVRIECEQYIGADRFARRAHTRFFFRRGKAPHLQLDRFEAEPHVPSHLGAQFLGGFAIEVIPA